MKNHILSRWTGLLVVLWVLLVARQAIAGGTWAPLKNPSPDNVNLMLLLSDGTVMAAHNAPKADAYSDWYRLTPDNLGHYTKGIWTTLQSMNYTRKYYSSQVLPNGRVFVAGGEYGTGSATAEEYDPVTDYWAPINPPPTSVLDPSMGAGFLDSESVMLPDGTVLIRPVADGVLHSGNLTLIYNPNANSWSSRLPPVRAQAEGSWVKLPDGSILSIDASATKVDGTVAGGTNSERYIPALQKWVKDANLPAQMFATFGAGYSGTLFGEIGPGLLLPNGKAFFLGGSGHTAIYTPSGTTNMGRWVAGPNIPAGLVSADAPAAMMPNGKILCVVAAPPLS
jgi:hypothetical protein